MRTALTIAAVLLAGSIAHAEDEGDSTAPLATARAAMEGGSPAKARPVVDGVLRAGHHGQDVTARLYEMSGEVAAALGDERDADLAFRRMLAIEPSARPHRSYASAVGPMFDRSLAAAQKSGPLVVTVRAGDNGGVIVRVSSDPVGMVSGAWAEYTTVDGELHEVLLPGRGGTAFLLPGRKAGSSVAAGVVDEYGNRLAEITVNGSGGTSRDGAPAAKPAPVAKAKPAPKAKPALKPVEPREAPDAPDDGDASTDRASTDIATPLPEAARAPGKPLYRRWPLWAGLAVAAGGAAGYFAHDTGKAEDEATALAADSSAHSYDELVAVEDRGRRSALLTNVSLGAAVALGATAVVMALWHDHPVEARPSTALRLEVGRASLGLAVAW